jgi:hypothetical protein
VSNFAPKRTEYGTGDRRWLRDMLKSESHGVSVTTADVTADEAGLVKSGSLIAGQGLVLNDFTIKATETHLISVVHAGTVDRRYLPAALTFEEEAALPAVVFINGTAPEPVVAP